jgi:hypothetical protein
LPAKSCNFTSQLAGSGRMANVGKLAAHHGNLIAAVESGADVAVLVNLVGKIFALRDLKSLPRKKLRVPA